MIFFLRILCVLLVALSSAVLRAQTAPAGYTLDLPVVPNAATPAWLGQPVTSSDPFAELDLPITPPDATSSLLVTVFFQEQNGSFLRVSWQSGAAGPAESSSTLPGPGEAALSSVLCDNFYEGIGMSNQRSLLVPADVMKQPGALRFQTGSAMLGISSIRIEWLENEVGLTSPTIHDVLVTPAGGPTEPASELAGLPPQAQDPTWHGRVVDVPVTDLPLRIEQGVDFTFQIDSVPSRARILLKEAGLPWGQHVVVWVNNQRAGQLIPATPRLDDGGYGATPANPYVGWREGSFLLPASDLVAGANTLQFSAEPDATSVAAPVSSTVPAPLAVKDVLLQLAYPAVAPAAAPAPATAAATPAAATPSAGVVSSDPIQNANASSSISTADSTTTP